MSFTKLALPLSCAVVAIFALPAQAATVSGAITPDYSTVVQQFSSPVQIGSVTEFTGAITENGFGQSFGITADFTASDLVFSFTSPTSPSANVRVVAPFNIFTLNFASAGLFANVGAPVQVTCGPFGCGRSQFTVSSTTDTLSVDVRGIFAGDSYRISFANAGVPEPSTWALFILGFGVIGGAMRARRRASISFA